MPRAEIISIGTELLLGEILDSNAQEIAKRLRGEGIDLYWMTTVGDNRVRIAKAIRNGLDRSDILICTGGLGPTVDDMSRDAIADGLGLELIFHEDLWEEIQLRFRNFGRQASENNKKQAYVPKGARIIDNAYGSAPAFLFEHEKKVVVSLPGVPGEMLPLLENHVLPYLAERYPQNSIIKSRILHTAAIGESRIDEKIADLEEMSNPTVGLAAHMGAVDIRLTAKADSEEAGTEMLNDLEQRVRRRLGDWIYGVDDETQSSAIKQETERLGWSLGIVQAGFDRHLETIFEPDSSNLIYLDNSDDLNETKARKWQADQNGRLAIIAQRITGNGQNEFEISIYSPNNQKSYSFEYGGSQTAAPEWGANLVAETLRRYLIKQEIAN
jgi:competence/damage-inducible protein CinA-like protein